MNVYLYLPRDVEYASSGVDLVEKMFKTKVRLIRKIPLEEKIENGVLWINSHGYKRTDDRDFMIEASGVKSGYTKYIRFGEKRSYIPSKHLPKFFNVTNSIILFDSCYSSEIDIGTLSKWKSNSIFTTGYMQDVYNDKWSGLIKTMCVIYDQLLVSKKIAALSPQVVSENREEIDKIIKFINDEYHTEFNLF